MDTVLKRIARSFRRTNRLSLGDIIMTPEEVYGTFQRVDVHPGGIIIVLSPLFDYNDSNEEKTRVLSEKFEYGGIEYNVGYVMELKKDEDEIEDLGVGEYGNEKTKARWDRWKD